MAKRDDERPNVTPPASANVTASVFSGISLRVVAVAAGVSHETVRRWRRGEYVSSSTTHRILRAIGLPTDAPLICGRADDSPCEGAVHVVRCDHKGCEWALAYCDGHSGRWVGGAAGGHRNLHQRTVREAPAHAEARLATAPAPQPSPVRPIECSTCGRALAIEDVLPHMDQAHGAGLLSTMLQRGYVRRRGDQ